MYCDVQQYSSSTTSYPSGVPQREGPLPTSHPSPPPRDPGQSPFLLLESLMTRRHIHTYTLLPDLDYPSRTHLPDEKLATEHTLVDPSFLLLYMQYSKTITTLYDAHISLHHTSDKKHCLDKRTINGTSINKSDWARAHTHPLLFK